MQEWRNNIILPVFQLSELTLNNDPHALKRVISQGKRYPDFTYYYRFISDEFSQEGFNYNLFPVVLNQDAIPWPIGMLYILSLLEGVSNPDMRTHRDRALDLGAYKKWLDDQENPDTLIFKFPKMKLQRPTYRYHGHLQRQIHAGQIEPTVAKRRMRAVIGFYRWLIENNYFQAEHPTWEEKHYTVSFSSAHGQAMFKGITSTDVSIHAPKADDPFDGTIQDGGKLRPLTGKEQTWILDATKANSNSECYLIQLFMLATGARIQTAGTLRLRHFINHNPPYSKALIGEDKVFKLKAGPGTGIDTKNNKNGVLQIPRGIYQLLHTYAHSHRSRLRRDRFMEKHPDHNDPYLFVTQQGNTYYTAKTDVMRFKPNFNLHHEKNGQSLRQCLKERVIPYIHEHHDPAFHYRLHDLRASYGMNITELLLKQVNEGKISLNRARNIVRELLWHDSLATTDGYLNYRSQMELINRAIDEYGEQLQEWIDCAMKGLGTDD